MSAKLNFHENLEKLNRFWIEKKEKELEDKKKQENENILKQLGLNKMFQDMKKRNELFELMNEDDFEVGNKEIMKNASKTKDIYNKTFDAMDNGNLKPLALKIFDIAKEEIKDTSKDMLKDKAKDSFEDFVSSKYQEVKKDFTKNDDLVTDIIKNLQNNNENPLNTLLKNLESDDKENDVTSDKENEKERDKNKNRMRLRDR